MEVLVALGVPESTPLFAALALVHLTGTTAISIRLVAVCAVVAEACIVRAVLPADWTNARVAIFTVWVT